MSLSKKNEVSLKGFSEVGFDFKKSGTGKDALTFSRKLDI